MKYIKHFGTREGYTSEENVLMSYDAFIAHFEDEDKSEVRWKGRLKNENAETDDNDEVLTVKALKFTTEGEATIGLIVKSYAVPNFEISRDGETWETWNNGSKVYATQSISADSPLYVRGDNPNGISNASVYPFVSFTMSGDNVSCDGNIMHLLSYEDDLDTIPCGHCYSSLFVNCTNLVKAPKLPATALAYSCYYNMFSGCTSLVNAPELPATTLADGCYSYMFSGCTSLVNAQSILPATILFQSCYSYMFKNCTNLVNAPKLYGTTIARDCYESMFYECTSLVTAPKLPATTLAEGCYKYMFYGCTSLENVSELPATTLANNCYVHMFNGCTSLEITPILANATLADFCYYYMFYNCTSLKTVICLCEDINLINYRWEWLTNVSTKGTFYKSPNALWNEDGDISPIPNGWSVEVYQG